MITLVIDEWTIVSIIFSLLIIALMGMGLTYYDLKHERDIYYEFMEKYKEDSQKYFHKWTKTRKEYKELEKEMEYMRMSKENECMVCKNYVCELVKDKNAIIFKCGKGLDTYSLEICKEYEEHDNSKEIRELLNEISYSSVLTRHGKVYMTERLLSYLNQNKEEQGK